MHGRDDLHNNSHQPKTMTASFISENKDQELSLQELQAANGGILMLIAACLPGVANAPDKGDDIYEKPSVWEVFKSFSTLGEPDGKEGGPPQVAPTSDGKSCTDRNLPL